MVLAGVVKRLLGLVSGGPELQQAAQDGGGSEQGLEQGDLAGVRLGYRPRTVKVALAARKASRARTSSAGTGETTATMVATDGQRSGQVRLKQRWSRVPGDQRPHKLRKQSRVESVQAMASGCATRRTTWRMPPWWTT